MNWITPFLVCMFCVMLGLFLGRLVWHRHPFRAHRAMSVGQTHRAWKIVDGEFIPCRAEDLRVNDIFVADNEPGVFLVMGNPFLADDGTWSVSSALLDTAGVRTPKKVEIAAPDEEICSECRRDGCPHGCNCWCHGKTHDADEKLQI